MIERPQWSSLRSAGLYRTGYRMLTLLEMSACVVMGPLIVSILILVVGTYSVSENMREKGIMDMRKQKQTKGIMKKQKIGHHACRKTK